MTNPESRNAGSKIPVSSSGNNGGGRLNPRPQNATSSAAERPRQPRDDLLGLGRRPTTSYHDPSALRGYGLTVPQDRSLHFGLPFGGEGFGIDGTPQSPALMSNDFMTNHARNTFNRQLFMPRSTGDTQANVPTRPQTVGSNPKVYDHAEGEGYQLPLMKSIPLAPLPLGNRIPNGNLGSEKRFSTKPVQREQGHDGQSQTATKGSPPPPPPKSNPTHSQIPLNLVYNPLHEQLMDTTLIYQRMFSSEILPNPPEGFLSGAEIPFENIPQSPLDKSFTPVIRYLSGYISSALHAEGEMHPRTSLLRTCEQSYGIPIDLLVDNLKKVVKVNEGVYGEVYSGYYENVPEPSVYKIVAVEGSRMINGEKQKRFAEIEPEIRVSQKLNTLRNPYGRNFTRGFCRLYRARLMEGKYPDVLVEAWIKWHERNVSENECPNIFEANQRYIVFEYEFGGEDVESFEFLNAEQAYSLLMQVAFTLATGEAGCEFEHRDLHWGNILVMTTKEQTVSYKINGVRYDLPTGGINSTVIDFTISRSLDKNNNPTFTDMADDEEQFMGTDGYQFEVYRMMRVENGNKWDTFTPKTNIFWLHYLVDKLINHGRYTQSFKSSPNHRAGMKRLKDFEDTIMKYGSCQEFATNQTKYKR